LDTDISSIAIELSLVTQVSTHLQQIQDKHVFQLKASLRANGVQCSEIKQLTASLTRYENDFRQQQKQEYNSSNSQFN
jgi:hypothetical protein